MAILGDLVGAIRRALPDAESGLIGSLCLGSLMIVLDSVGVDVIENVRATGMWELLFPFAIAALLSVFVERLREAFESTDTLDRVE